jgi:hypothetical protein
MCPRRAHLLRGAPRCPLRLRIAGLSPGNVRTAHRRLRAARPPGPPPPHRRRDRGPADRHTRPSRTFLRRSLLRRMFRRSLPLSRMFRRRPLLSRTLRRSPAPSRTFRLRRSLRSSRRHRGMPRCRRPDPLPPRGTRLHLRDPAFGALHRRTARPPRIRTGRRASARPLLRPPTPIARGAPLRPHRPFRRLRPLRPHRPLRPLRPPTLIGRRASVRPLPPHQSLTRTGRSSSASRVAPGAGSLARWPAAGLSGTRRWAIRLV